MSEFSVDASGQVLNVTSKTTEALMRFLKYLIERGDRHTQREIERLNLQKLKDASEQRKALEKVEGTFGLVNAKELQKSGIPLSVVSMSLNKKEVEKFSAYLKRSGVSAAMVTDKRKTDKEQIYAMYIKQRDTEVIKKIADRMTMDAKLESIDGMVDELKSKQVLTERDKNMLNELQSERDKLLHADTMKFNHAQNRATFEEICEGRKGNAKTFNEALNHYTDRNYARGEPYFVCERTKPLNHIECRSHREMFRNKEYTKTNYTVFKDGVQVLQTHDGRFEGRGTDYWGSVKKQIKDMGELTDDLLIFDTREEFMRYRELYKEQQRELSDLEQTGHIGRDYGAMIEQLRRQLDVCGAELDDQGNAVDKSTKQYLRLKEGQDPTEQAGISEAVCIAKQIKNYNVLAKMETEITMRQFGLDGMDKDADEYKVAQAELENKRSVYDNAIQLEKSLINDRCRVNGAQAVQTVEQERTNGVDNEKGGDENKCEKGKNRKRTMDEWKREITKFREKSDSTMEVEKLQRLGNTTLDERSV